jgi:hypothetical protein
MHELEEGQTHLEQSFHHRHLFLVEQEQNDVVFGLNNYVVVSDHHFVASHDSTDCRSGGKLDVLDSAAHDFGTLCITVGDCLDGFGSPASQTVDLSDIGPPDMREQ